VILPNLLASSNTYFDNIANLASALSSVTSGSNFANANPKVLVHPNISTYYVTPISNSTLYMPIITINGETIGTTSITFNLSITNTDGFVFAGAVAGSNVTTPLDYNLK